LPVAPLDAAELRRLLHELREPLGAFAIYVALLEGEEITTAAQAHLKAMHGNVERMTAALNAIDFALENGASRPSARR
jgi:signal transduction histidine kinase